MGGARISTVRLRSNSTDKTAEHKAVHTQLKNLSYACNHEELFYTFRSNTCSYKLVITRLAIQITVPTPLQPTLMLTMNLI